MLSHPAGRRPSSLRIELAGCVMADSSNPIPLGNLPDPTDLAKTSGMRWTSPKITGTLGAKTQTQGKDTQDA